MGSGKGKARRARSAQALTPLVDSNAAAMPTGSGHLAGGSGSDAAYATLAFHHGRPHQDLGEERGELATQPDYWRRTLDGFTHSSGISISVPARKPYDGLANDRENPSRTYAGMGFYADLKRDGELIGDLNFTVFEDANGDLEMRLHGIELREYPHDARSKEHERTYEHTNTGFGTACIEHVKALAAAGGVRHASLHTVGGGSYFWSRCGFDLDPREYPWPSGNGSSPISGAEADVARRANVHQFSGKMLEVMRKMESEDPEMSATIASFTQAVRDEQPKTLQELFALVDSRRTVHPRVGRSLPLVAEVLDQTSWNGICFLTPPK